MPGGGMVGGGEVLLTGARQQPCDLLMLGHIPQRSLDLLPHGAHLGLPAQAAVPPVHQPVWGGRRGGCEGAEVRSVGSRGRPAAHPGAVPSSLPVWMSMGTSW